MMSRLCSITTTVLRYQPEMQDAHEFLDIRHVQADVGSSSTYRVCWPRGEPYPAKRIGPHF